MRLLEAVNTILPALGEHTVTSTDVKHPTVAVILQALRTQLRDTLLQDWWFNTYEYDALPDEDGFINLPDSYIKALPVDPFSARTGAVKRGSQLYNMRDRTFVWPIGQRVRLRVTESLDFEMLPESVAQYVMYQGCTQAYLNDIGVEATLNMWRLAAGAAYATMLTEHLENRRYSTARSPRAMRYFSSLRG